MRPPPTGPRPTPARPGDPCPGAPGLAVPPRSGIVAADVRRASEVGDGVGARWRSAAGLGVFLAASLLAACLNPRPEELPSAAAPEPGAALDEPAADFDAPEGSRAAPPEDVSKPIDASDPAASVPPAPAPPASAPPAPADAGGDAAALPDAGAPDDAGDAG